MDRKHYFSNWPFLELIKKENNFSQGSNLLHRGSNLTRGSYLLHRGSIFRLSCMHINGSREKLAAKNVSLGVNVSVRK